MEKIKELKDTFSKHRLRLQIVIENKQKEQMEIFEGLRDDPQNDLYSDTSSITGQSAISSSSRSSKGTRTSGFVHFLYTSLLLPFHSQLHIYF